MKQKILFKFMLNINYVLNIQHRNTLLSDRYYFAVILGSKIFFFSKKYALLLKKPRIGGIPRIIRKKYS